MMSFRQLLEVKRTAKQAAELFDKVVERRDKNRPFWMKHDNITTDNFVPLIKHHDRDFLDTFNNYLQNSSDWHEVSMKVPLNKLRTGQRPIYRGAMPDKIYQRSNPRFEETEKPRIFYSHHTGSFYLRDGNHRASAARLRGETHIDATVLKRKDVELK
jgi:hypothetical protein